LSWDSFLADSCAIEPGIGTVGTSGTISVSPAQTTTYTITATGPKGSNTASVTVYVVEPSLPPSVNISAVPMQVGPDSIVTLTWNAVNADSCIIEPGIGAIGMSGSIKISPNETTSYTITASNFGGSATASVNVTVVYPAPVATISADPLSINQGESTTLSWSTTSASSCVIEPGIGEVNISGSMVISPTATTTYTITATGLGGNTTVQTTVTVTDVIHLQIISPAQGEEINKPYVMVKGTFSNALGLETGITVNGQVAMTYGNEFVANQVSLEDG